MLFLETLLLCRNVFLFVRERKIYYFFIYKFGSLFFFSLVRVRSYGIKSGVTKSGFFGRIGIVYIWYESARLSI